MRLFSKLALFSSLAAILAVAFTSASNHRKASPAPQQAAEAQKGAPLNAVKPATSSAVPAAPAAPEARSTSRFAGKSAVARVTMPAIRGGTNYGWIQLPHGTRVDLVKESGSRLVVRWDGTLVSIDSNLAAKGAVVLKNAPRG
jgi:hypothetical protein